MKARWWPVWVATHSLWAVWRTVDRLIDWWERRREKGDE